MDDLEKCKQKTLQQYQARKKINQKYLQKIKDCQNIRELLELRKKLDLVDWEKK